jgi:large subunit ribosomal protein L18
MQGKQEKRYRRHKRIRAKVKGTAVCPRLSVFRSNRHTYAQLIDDEVGKTLVSVSDYEIKHPRDLSKTELAKQIGVAIAKKALAKDIEKVVFDRSGYKYHGRVKAIAEGAREGGLRF